MTTMYIPDKILVSCQERINGGSRSTKYYKPNPGEEIVLLAYITYKDHKGVLRKKDSFESWEKQSNPRQEISNEPRSGFRLESLTKRSAEWFGTGRTMFYILHPDGFRFEISSNNLLEIAKVSSIDKGELKGNFVFSWGGQSNSLSLLSCESDWYEEHIKTSQALKEKKELKISSLKPGDIVISSGLKIPHIYLGCYERIGDKYVSQSEFPREIRVVEGKKVNWTWEARKLVRTEKEHLLISLESYEKFKKGQSNFYTFSKSTFSEKTSSKVLKTGTIDNDLSEILREINSYASQNLRLSEFILWEKDFDVEEFKLEYITKSESSSEKAAIMSLNHQFNNPNYTQAGTYQKVEYTIFGLAKPQLFEYSACSIKYIKG